MRFKKNKFALHRTGVAASLLLLASGAVMAQQQVNLTAGPASAMLPDGSALPMWGYSCQPLPQGVNSTATCAALNLKAGSGAWSPVVITIPYGQDLQINLTNSLTFTTSGAPNNIPTSIVIVGQLGGGLGSAPTRTTSPAHAQQGVTWATVNSAGTGNPTFTPPQQNDRVQSFSTEVAAGATTSLVWKAPRPGTYLIESGTHPSIQGPMGLYGVLVVTSPPGTSTVYLPGAVSTGVSAEVEVVARKAQLLVASRNLIAMCMT